MATMAPFLLGFLAGALALFTGLMAYARRAAPEAKKARRWTRIENIRFTWNFDYEFSEPVDLKDLAAAMPRLMAVQLKNKPLPADSPSVDPGAYTVELLLHARFIGRDPSDLKRS